MIGRAGSLLGLLVLTLLSPAPKALDAQDIPSTDPELLSLRFEGNQAIPDDSLHAAIANRQSSCKSIVLAPLCWIGVSFAEDRQFYQPRQLVRDSVRLAIYYEQRGYEGAEFAWSLDELPEGVTLTFDVREGEPHRIRSFEIVGADQLHDPAIVGDIPFGVGDIADEIRIDAERDALLARLRSAGYIQADVLVNRRTPVGELVTDIVFDIDAGSRARFGTIEVEGNEKLSDRAVLRSLPFQAGTFYSPERVAEGERNLYDLGPITAVSPVQQPMAFGDTIVDFTIRVTEGDIHRVRTGLGWSTAECLNLESRWTSRNFLGGARRLEVRGRLSNIFASRLNGSACPQSGSGEFAELNWLASVDFRQPWIFSQKNVLTIGLFGERQSLADVFVRRAFGVTTALTRTISDRTALTVAYRPEVTRLDAAEIFFCSSFLVCTPEDIGVLQGNNLLAPLAVTWTRDRTEPVLNPNQGYLALAEYEHASSVTGSDFSFDRVTLEARRYSPWQDAVIATRFRGGWVGSGGFDALRLEGEPVTIIHPQKRFYAGGSNSVRGFAENRLGPRVLSTDVARLLIPDEGETAACTAAEVIDLSCDAGPLTDSDFASRATGGGIVLEGNLEVRVPLGSPRWEGAGFIDFGQVWEDADAVDLSTIEFTPGFGFRYISPIGPVRVDVGYRFQDMQNLRVVTSAIRPFDSSLDDPSDRIERNGQILDFVRTDELALLGPRVLSGNPSGFSLRRFQLHISIGQAF